MKQSLLRYFAWISLVLMVSVSCRSSRIYVSGEQADRISESFFTDSFEKITFKAKVIYQERELAGLMLIKNTWGGNYKIAFFNELGMTYLEGTLENSSKRKKLVVKNIAPILDHKIFVKNLERSLQKLLSPGSYRHLPTSAGTDPKENIIFVQLCNGFRLELKLQITQINTD